VNENEAITNLTLEMCDTDQARAFVGAIPKLSEIVSMPDLKQITA
jgi:hypothetical protein